MLRRWLVVLLGILLTGGVAGYIYMNSEPRYQATARMILLLPADARGPESHGSPFLYLPNGLNVIARIVSGAPQSSEFREAMAKEGLSSGYTVGVDPTTPILTVSTEGTDPGDVVATRDWIVEQLNEELRTLQLEEGAPPQQVAHTRVYANEDVPLALGGDWQRSVLAAGAAGGLLTLVAAFAIDRLLAVRRKHKERKKALSLASGDDGPPADDPPQGRHASDETVEVAASASESP
ncbi:MAG: hypothetical protein GX596_14265 [Propionibacterium sp.]|nr:hypothetical protein [Propionibacterium sp.]